MIGPVIVRHFINLNLSIPLELMQPTGQDNNDTSSSVTGSSLIGNVAASGGGGGASGTAAASTSNSFLAFGATGRRFRPL